MATTTEAPAEPLPLPAPAGLLLAKSPSQATLLPAAAIAMPEGSQDLADTRPFTEEGSGGLRGQAVAAMRAASASARQAAEHTPSFEDPSEPGDSDKVSNEDVVDLKPSGDFMSRLSNAIQEAEADVAGHIQLLKTSLRVPEEDAPDLLDGELPKLCFMRRGSARHQVMYKVLELISIWSVACAPLMSAFWITVPQGLSVDAAHYWEPPLFLLRADFALGVLYAIGAVLLPFRTSAWGSRDQSEHVKQSRICKSVCTSASFWADVLSSIPLCLFLLSSPRGGRAVLRFLASASPHQQTLLRFLPLLALVRLRRLGRPGFENGAAERGVMLQMIAVWLIMGISFVAHFYACFWFMTMDLSGSIADRPELLADFESRGLAEPYSHMLWIGAGVLSGLVAPPAQNSYERFVLSCGFMVSATTMAVVFAEVVSVNSLMKVMSSRHHEQLSYIRAATHQLGVDAHLRRKVLRYHSYVVRHHDTDCYRALMEGLSDSLLVELKMQLYRSFIDRSVLLHSLSREKIIALVLAFEEYVFCPGDLIVKHGDVGSEMYFIVKGSCDVMLSDYTPLAVKRRGDYFGEVCLLFPDMKRTANVRTRTFCVIAKLVASKFDEIIKDGTREREIMRDAAMASFQNVKPEEPTTSPGGRGPTLSSAMPGGTPRTSHQSHFSKAISTPSLSPRCRGGDAGIRILTTAVDEPGSPALPSRAVSTPSLSPHAGSDPKPSLRQSLSGGMLDKLDKPARSAANSPTTTPPRRRARMLERDISVCDLEEDFIVERLAAGVPLTPKRISGRSRFLAGADDSSSAGDRQFRPSAQSYNSAQSQSLTSMGQRPSSLPPFVALTTMVERLDKLEESHRVLTTEIRGLREDMRARASDKNEVLMDL